MTAGDLITGDGQLEFNGMLFNDGNITYINDDGITGWEDLPGIDSGDVPKPSEHGSWPGSQYAQERIVTWSGWWRPPPYEADAGATLRALRAATTIDKSGTERPLVIQLLGEKLLAYGKMSARVIGTDLTYSMRAGKISLQWTCSDSRRYSAGNENQLPIALDTFVPAGLDYPLDYPLDYGTAQPPSGGTAVNAMEADAPTRLVLTGPSTNPKIINSTSDIFLAFKIPLTADDVFVVDTGAGTVTLNGVDQKYTRTSDSVPIVDFVLAAGDNDLRLTADTWSTGAGMTVFWRDATF